MRNLLKKFFKNMGEKMGKLFDFGGHRGGAKKEGNEDGDPQKENNGPKVVEIVRYVSGGELVVFLRCELVGEEVKLTVVEDGKNQEDSAGAKNIFKSLEEMGVFLAAENKTVYPKDGPKFLDALLQNYDHPYLLARVIK